MIVIPCCLTESLKVVFHTAIPTASSNEETLPEHRTQSHNTHATHTHTHTPQVSEVEETLTAEAVRRQLVLDKRRETCRRERQRAERRESLKAAGRLVDVEVTGTFEASARCLFLFDRARMTGGVSLSSDLATAACTGTGNRGMVLGSRGFRAGLHYWEVGVKLFCFWPCCVLEGSSWRVRTGLWIGFCVPCCRIVFCVSCCIVALALYDMPLKVHGLPC